MQMRRKILGFLLFGGLAVAASGQSPAQFSKYSGPNALGPYRIDRDVDVRSFLSALGYGLTGKRDLYCFIDKSHNLYLYARTSHDGTNRVDQVFLSTFPNCYHAPALPANIDPTNWKTPEGIGIGSTKEEILQTYGKPLFSDQLTKGKDAWVIAGIEQSEWSRFSVGDSTSLYACWVGVNRGCDDLRAARMGFSKGRLIWILISDSE